MSNPFVHVFALSMLVFSGVAQARMAAGETWRLQSSQPAPWAPETAMGGPQPPADWHIEADRMSGPAALACSAARHSFTRLPPEALFEGNLPPPAAQAAKRLGLPAGMLITQRIICDSGSFDLHRDVAGHAWLGLDNRVLLFDLVAVTSSPEATVQALLIAHFDTGMALNPASVAAKAQSLTPALQQRLHHWLAVPPSPDEVPDLNGDPFTDSQEPPLSFELVSSRVDGAAAEVTVRFEFEGDQAPGPGPASQRNVVMQLILVDGSWRIDELRYADGSRLSQLLGR